MQLFASRHTLHLALLPIFENFPPCLSPALPLPAPFLLLEPCLCPGLPVPNPLCLLRALRLVHRLQAPPRSPANQALRPR